MTTIKTSDTTSQPSLKSPWLNPKRKRYWAVIGVLLYSVLGFFAVSAIIKTKLVDLIEEDLGREARIQAVFFNPYALSLRVRQFEMRDTDGVRLAAFDDFYVNFQLSSLFRWAWTFDEIRLDNSYFFYERFSELDSRISRMLADTAKNKPPQAESDNEESAGLPRLLIHELALNGGAAQFKDNVPDTPVAVDLGPININIKKLNTLPDQYGKQTVAIDLPDEGRLQWQGNLSLTPLDSQGEMRLTNANMMVIKAYLKAMLPLESLQARLSSRLNYHVRLNDKGELALDIDNLDVELDRFAVTGLSPSTEFFAFEQLALEGGKLRYPEQTIEFSRLSFIEPKAVIWRKQDGSLSINDLIPPPEIQEIEEQQAPPGDDQSARSWRVALNELLLEQGGLNFTDHSTKPAAQIGIMDLNVKASEISNQPGAKIPVSVAANLEQGGELGLYGTLEIFPDFSFVAQTKTRDIPLSISQPYVQQYTRIQVYQGSLDSDLTINIPAGQALAIAGALKVPELEIRDAIESKRLLAWKNLTIDELGLDLAANTLTLSPLKFEELFGRIIIYKDKSTNLSGLVVEQDKKPISNNTAPTQDEFDVVIGGVSIEKSGMDFSDLSLPLPFATRIESLNGSISTIATNSSQPANIKLEGQVDDYGLARINGAIDLLDPLHRTGVEVLFRNLLMSDLSPYTIEFAGRKIAEGKLDLDLNYEISKSQLEATNKVLISDLELGEKVEAPNAADLPLGLAVALLKDPNGKIDINLPIEGNIDDPKFRIGGIIWKAFAGLIVKAVTSPFRLLGGLIGVESDDLGKFQFLAGRSDLTPPELEKVAHIKRALAQRPNLNVEIKGAVARELDRPALKYSALRSTLISRFSESTKAELSDVDVLDQRLSKPLKSLFKERFPDTRLKTIRELHKRPPVDNPEGRPVLDQLAYMADLRDRLLTTVNISDEDLMALADARAQAIKEAFLIDGFDVSRVVVAESQVVKAEDDQWVKFELGVLAK